MPAFPHRLLNSSRLLRTVFEALMSTVSRQVAQLVAFAKKEVWDQPCPARTHRAVGLEAHSLPGGAERNGKRQLPIADRAEGKASRGRLLAGAAPPGKSWGEHWRQRFLDAVHSRAAASTLSFMTSKRWE